MELTFLSNKASELYTKMEQEYVTNELDAYLKNEKFSENLDLRNIKPLIDAQFLKQVLNAVEASFKPKLSHQLVQIILKMAHLESFEVKTTLSRIHITKSLKDILTNKIEERMKFPVSQLCDKVFHENILKWNKKIFDFFVMQKLKSIEISCEIRPGDDTMISPIVFYAGLSSSSSYFTDMFSWEMLKRLNNFFGPNFEIVYDTKRKSTRRRHLFSISINALFT